MSLYQLKSQFQDQLRPLSNTLVEHEVTANQVTVTAVLLSVGTAYVIAKPAQQKPILRLLLPTSLFIRMALNAIDGMMAREHGQASKLGAWLNEAGDIIADSALIASLSPHISPIANSKSEFQVYSQPISRFITLSVSTELLAIISSQYFKVRANQGPLGKSDRALLLGVIGIVMGTKPSLLTANIALKSLGLLIQALLIKTCLNRLRFMAELYLLRNPPVARLKSATASVIKPSTVEANSFKANIAVNIQPNITFTPSLTGSLLLANPLAKFASTSTLSSCAARVLSPKLVSIDTASYPSEYDLMPTSLLAAEQKSASAFDIDIDTDTNAIDAKALGNGQIVNDPSTDKPTASRQTAVPDLIAGESCYNAYDGTAIYYRYWLTMPLDTLKNATSALRQVILLHRGHEHSGRLAELGEQFANAGYQVFAWDARGNGRSGGIKDHAKSVTELERDLDDFVQLVIGQTTIAIEDTLIVASSIGAVLAAAWVHDYAPNIRAMILGTPALSIRLYMPFAIPTLKVARTLGLMARVSSYVKAQVLTHDKQAQQAYNADPLISSSISTDLLIDTHATGQRLLDDAAAITVPTFILCAGKDYVVDKQAERSFYDAINTATKRWQLYPDSYHAIFHETNKAEVFADCIEFAAQVFSTTTATTDLRSAHLSSASKDKVDRLAIKPFNANFAITRFAMQKFGKVSSAIATGLEHGFDSGNSLDHVYYNQPSGKGGLGKAVDKFYLNNIGWQGIRIRREHILELGAHALAEIELKNNYKNKYDDTQGKVDLHQRYQSKPYQPKLLDIACGHGFYAFDLLTSFAELQAELRDYDTHNIQALQAKAQRLNLGDRVLACQRDAFDPASYQQDNNSEKFDMAIASGVFELFSDNTLPATALTGIYASLKEQGYLLYTNQPWHPEQEFISKTLNNHRGSSWVMRCRSQAEMDQLVDDAGFDKIAMRIDKFGIFTVSLAIKRSVIKDQSLTVGKQQQAAS
ncbi:alpha/beta fold hydrolase [Psychrobacter sp. TAE2020]|uniref:alpha/beta fold hydrolase n=1 Tax=Psychrobacter sp. TAE2020 TaxID=2846762 RepID=UPI001C0FC014|nr:alpha/beta fold hydrolase [Psychrobacter sp. TAE2020]MBU5616464.1 alpha/beta fold hydrolase [Psychrobacter sp. TAE2020]